MLKSQSIFILSLILGLIQAQVIWLGLKISEGCNRNCTFCIIPTLRGRLRSRSIESLVTEAKSLVESGVRELNLISQDFSDYGSDFEGFAREDNKNPIIFNMLKSTTR